MYLLGTKILTNNANVQRALGAMQSKSRQEPFDEYTRDDYAKERMRYGPDTTDMQLIEEGVVLADYEYTYGPDPQREQAIMDPLNWYNGPNMPSISTPQGYLI